MNWCCSVERHEGPKRVQLARDAKVAAALWPEAADVIRSAYDIECDLSPLIARAIDADKMRTSHLLARLTKSLGDCEGMPVQVRIKPKEDAFGEELTEMRLLLSSNLNKIRFASTDDVGEDVEKVLDFKKDISKMFAGSLHDLIPPAPAKETLITIVTSHQLTMLFAVGEEELRDELLFGLLVLMDCTREKSWILKMHDRKAI